MKKLFLGLAIVTALCIPSFGAGYFEAGCNLTSVNVEGFAKGSGIGYQAGFWAGNDNIDIGIRLINRRYNMHILGAGLNLNTIQIELEPRVKLIHSYLTNGEITVFVGGYVGLTLDSSVSLDYLGYNAKLFNNNEIERLPHTGLTAGFIAENDGIKTTIQYQHSTHDGTPDNLLNSFSVLGSIGFDLSPTTGKMY